MGKLNITAKRPEEQFVAVDDEKLRTTLVAMADRYDEQIRDLIYRTYQDDELARIYRAIRASGVYQKGGKSKVHRKIVEFPNAYIYDFVDATLSALYGPDWFYNNKALKHDLVRPWWVVHKL